MGVMLLKRKLTSFQIIILGFSGVILFGTFLLMLPFFSRSGLATPFSDALFTSISVVCVTGLIIHDTATYWSGFGRFIILPENTDISKKLIIMHGWCFFVAPQL